MANMSYCRFENTERDLRDCEEHILDVLSADEHKARTRLIKLCESILEQVDDVELEFESEDEEEDDEPVVNGGE